MLPWIFCIFSKGTLLYTCICTIHTCCLCIDVALAQNKLAGGEGTSGMYGSITQMGMQKVLDAFKLHCGLDEQSIFVDIGAGIGR